MVIDLPALAKRTTKRSTLLMRPVVMTQAIENELYSIYYESVALWQFFITNVLVPAYEIPAEFIADADGSQMQWLIDQQAVAVNNRLIYQTEKLGRWVTRVNNWHTSKTINAAKSATGVDISPFIRLGDVRPQLELSIRENANLISNVNADTKKRIEQALFDALAQRKSKTWLVQELQKAMGISRRRARVIATDQTHKLNALLTRFRNEQLGIDGYVWKTVLDDRVRHAHQMREGKQFRWDAPPPDGHPGYPVNCRCHAQSVLIMDSESDDS